MAMWSATHRSAIAGTASAARAAAVSVSGVDCGPMLRSATPSRMGVLLPRRPGRAAQEFRLPAVAVAQALDHPPAALGALLAAREEPGELIPVLDALQEYHLVMAAGPGRHRPAGGDRDHAGVARLRVEDRAERLDVLRELARKRPAGVVQIQPGTCRTGSLERGGREVDVL